VAERDAELRAASAWIDARLAVELMRIRQEMLDEAEELLRLATARVRAGRSEPGEEALARSLVGSARASLLEAEGRKVAALTELRFSTGIAQSRSIDPVGPIDARDAPLDEKSLLSDALSRHPSLELLTAEARRRDSAAELSLASGRPFLSVGTLVTHEGTGDWIVEARAALPLPFVNPAAVDAARLQAEAMTAHAEVTRMRALLETELRISLHEREHSREARDVLREGAIAPAREALGLAEKQYAAGSVDLAVVIGAHRQLLDAEQRWAEAAASVKRADLRLAASLGRDLADVTSEGAH